MTHRGRIIVEGAGSTALVALVPGDTLILVGDASHYNSAGGLVAIAQNKVTYTGTQIGGSGALVGTTVTPTNGPTVTKRATTGLSSGTHQWAYLFGTAAGRTTLGPLTSATLGDALPPPSSAPSPTKAFGGNLSAGVYKWKVAYLTAAGETLASAESSAVTMDDVAAPTTIGTASDGGNPSGALGSGLDYNATYSYKYTFSDGVRETLPSPASNVVTTLPIGSYASGRGASNYLTDIGVQSPPAGFYRRFYRTDGGGSTYKLMPGSIEGWDDHFGGYFGPDTRSDATLSYAAPSTNTAIYRSASVYIYASTNPLVTGLRLYRTTANGATFKKVADLANTSGYSTDTVADASLGSTELSTATALNLAADLSGIAVGPTGTTYREVYRKPPGGPDFKLLTTLANNTTTTYTDTTADGSLGAVAPTADTSGLVSQAGEVAAGSTTMAITSTGPFRSAGGWASIGALLIRYTGFSGAALSGIPASGVGALTTTVRYGVEVIAAPMLTGIPASGPGSIQYACPSGEPVNLVVTVNDTAAQVAMANFLGSSDPNDGIFEEYIQDNRLSEAEALNRADARLKEVKDPLVTVEYTTRDSSTRSGREVTITLDAPWNVTGTFKIQSVTIDHFDPLGKLPPLRHVVASSRRFRLEDYLRLIKGG